MKFTKKIHKKISSVCFKIIAILKIIIFSIIYRNKIYLFGIPMYGNLGDQAILLSEEKFLKENFKDIKIIKVPSPFVQKYIKVIQKLVKINDGYKIIVFPQTVYFSKDEEGKKILEESRKIYYKHKNLYICCREKYSYDFMKEQFPLCNIVLVPDMVLYLDNIENNSIRRNALFCIRQDKEKVQYNLDGLKEILLKNGIEKIDYTDTVIPEEKYYLMQNKKLVNNKINEFSKYKIIITDRLHGMIFSLLSNTPCLVLENINYKVKGVYEWIKDVQYIKLCNQENIEQQINELLNQEKIQYDNKQLIKKYKPLIELIKNEINQI